MGSNWNGFLGARGPASEALHKLVTRDLAQSTDPFLKNVLYSVFASGPGIFGLGNHVSAPGLVKQDVWNIANPEHLMGGVNHFGSPFNFPEEFTTVYRLHPLVPDLIEYREWQKDPNVIQTKIPVADTFRARGTQQMLEHGIASWALSMGRQRLGLLTLHNHPAFLQNLPMPRLHTQTNTLDVPALDILRDRERGIPRFNEFRRQIGLKQLTGFDDFIGPENDKERKQIAATLREVYGQHTCDASKVISEVQLNPDGSPINDCLGHPNGSVVDNIEDLDTVVGWLAEPSRPHGFAISETQFHIFILNASRRLFSDRFFTSSFRPEIYTQLGIRWVEDNGPSGKVFEEGMPNGHQEEVSPLKRILLRNVPELEPELRNVVNVFDPWARDRGEYYSLAWKPRKGAESDSAFTE
jgi:hypothetical protein